MGTLRPRIKETFEEMVRNLHLRDDEEGKENGVVPDKVYEKVQPPKNEMMSPQSPPANNLELLTDVKVYSF